MSKEEFVLSWTLDPYHTSIEFSARHMMVSTVRGHFTEFSAELEIEPEDLTRSSAKASIKAASIDTRVAPRNDHLRSGDFFDAEKYPELTYQSRRIEALGGDRYRVEGDLTIKDVTKPVVLDVSFLGINKSPQGATVAGFEATGKLNRSDFGLTYNAALEAGGVVIGDEIKITIDAEANLTA
ncbi:MAG TPA: YceI family protein [Candidatus Dormibacteraeota bacterium]|nr:YceI family protein [Candidatus Dormibacteraeota bacterium]